MVGNKDLAAYDRFIVLSVVIKVLERRPRSSLELTFLNSFEIDRHRHR
jgi:hypothetical protein